MPTSVGKAAARSGLCLAAAAEEWRLADLHGLATGRGTTIAIIDSKIETGHPDLSGQFAANRDFLANGPAAAESHGTGVAGIIAAKADNGMGVVGIAPDARLMALRACSERPRGGGAAAACDSLTLAKALHFALEHSADVINMSLSGPADPLLASLIAIVAIGAVTRVGDTINTVFWQAIASANV